MQLTGLEVLQFTEWLQLEPLKKRLEADAKRAVVAAHDADDLISSFRVALATRQRPIEMPDDFAEWPAYLGRAFRNHIINLFHRETRTGFQFSQDEALEAWVASIASGEDRDVADRCAAIEAAIANLPNEQRWVVLMVIDGYGEEEISFYSHTPLNTIKSRKHAAKKKLIAALDLQIQSERKAE